MKKLMSFFLAVFMVITFFGSANAIYDTEEYDIWRSVGVRAAEEALALMISSGGPLAMADLIAMTNAGYAEINGRTTQGSLDGLVEITGVSRGQHRLLEIHTLPGKPLYFALFDSQSGICAYLQVDPSFIDVGVSPDQMDASLLFSKMSVENIKAENLFANPSQYGEKFNAKIFGGNEFAIVTILNAVAAGAPTYAVRSFEFHDHYCPGVTSGILIAQYVKKHFAMQTPSDSYFVQGIQPWCKEDALMVMLNATPGKGGYSVTYPTNEDKAGWYSELGDIVNIIYRQNGSTGIWEGMALGYTGGNTGCPDYNVPTIDKLCSDLWYLENMDRPEDFVDVILSFDLPEGFGPKDLARPGFDPLAAQK